MEVKKGFVCTVDEGAGIKRIGVNKPRVFLSSRGLASTVRGFGRENRINRFSPILNRPPIVRSGSIPAKLNKARPKARIKEISSKEKIRDLLRRISKETEHSEIFGEIKPLLEKAEKDCKAFPTKLFENLIEECEEGFSENLESKIAKIVESKLIFEDKFSKEAKNITVKKLMELKKANDFDQDSERVLSAFVCILADLEPLIKPYRSNFEFYDSLRLFLSNPGKIVELVRNIPLSIKKQQISAENIEKAKELIKSVQVEEGNIEDLLRVINETINLFELYKPYYEPKQPMLDKTLKIDTYFCPLEHKTQEIRILNEKEDEVAKILEANRGRTPEVDYTIISRSPSIFNEKPEFMFHLTQENKADLYKYQAKARLLHKFYSEIKGTEFEKHPFSLNIKPEYSQTRDISRHHIFISPILTPRIQSSTPKKYKLNSQNYEIENLVKKTYKKHELKMKKHKKREKNIRFSQTQNIIEKKRGLVEIQNREDKFTEVREAQKLLESEREKLELILKKYKEMDKKAKKLLKVFQKWGETLEMPMNQNEIDTLWLFNYNHFADKVGLDNTSREEIKSIIEEATLSVLTENNIEKITEKLQEIADKQIEAAKSEDFAVEIESSKELARIINEAAEKGSAMLLEYLNSMISHSHPSRPHEKVKEITFQFWTALIETSKLSEYFEPISQLLEKILSEVKERISQALSELEMRNLKEEYILINTEVENFQGLLRTEFFTEFDIFIPGCLQSLYLEEIENCASALWSEAYSRKLQQLTEMFEVFGKEMLNQLESAQLSLFDPSFLSPEAKYAFTALLIISIPKKEAIYYKTLDPLFEILHYSTQEIEDLISGFSDNLSAIEEQTEIWNQNTNTESRLFTLLSLVLFLSDSYKILVPGYQSDDLENEGWKREWMREWIHLAFQIKYSDYFSGKSQSEYEMVLMSEGLIVRSLQEKNIIWTLEDQSVNAKPIIEELQAFSEAPPSKKQNFLNKVSGYANEKNRNKYLSKALNKVVEVSESKFPIEEFIFECVNDTPSLHVTIAVSGWLSQDDEMASTWTHLVEYEGQRRVLALRWDSSSSSKLWKKKKLLLAPLILLNPITFSIGIYSLFKYDPFKKSAEQAEIVGKALAHLINSNFFGNATISLISFSLGTRVVFFCLQELYELQNKKIHDCILLGGASPLNTEKWGLCREVVQGRMINTYCKTDKILSVLYSVSKLEKAIGLHPLDVPGIENYDVTKIAEGHLKYRENLQSILEHIKYNREMLSQFFILSDRGDTIIARDFRGDLIRTSHELFFRRAKLWKGDPPPAFNLEGINFLHIRKGGLYFLVTTLHNIEPTFVFEMLQRLSSVIKDFCGVLNEDALRKNFVLAYEVIDEMIDCGYPESVSTEEVRPFLVNEPISLEPAARPGFLTPNTVSHTAVHRSVVAKKEKDEIFVDIFEKISVLMNPSGFVINSSIDGCIEMKSYLQGNPLLRLCLNEDLAVNCNFHECVNSNEFNDFKILTIDPPDGEFVAMNYRIQTDFPVPFRIYAFIDNLSEYRFDLTVKIRANFPSKNYGANVMVKCNLPEKTTNATFEVPKEGTAEYKDRVAEMKVKKFVGETELTWKIKGGLSEAVTAREIGPVAMSFEIPMFNVSNVEVKYLRIADEGKKSPNRWVRYVTNSSSYVCRLN